MQLIVRKSDNEVMWLRQSNNFDTTPESKLLNLNYICQYAGGKSDDYELIEVPPELKKKMLGARNIIYDGEKFQIDDRPLVIIQDMQITITSGWIRANEKLNKDVIINIPVDNDNNRELEIEVVRDGVTDEIQIVRHLWLEKEDKTILPMGKTLIDSILKINIPAGTNNLGGL